jgi:hypothetical protein
MTAARWIVCGNFVENRPLKSFSVSLHLKDLIMSQYYLKRIISSSDIAFRLAWKFRAPPAAGHPPPIPVSLPAELRQLPEPLAQAIRETRPT